MKFGSQLKGSLYKEWAEYYLDYDGLKKHLKRGEKQERGYTEKDESDFVEKLDKELVKVCMRATEIPRVIIVRLIHDNLWDIYRYIIFDMQNTKKSKNVLKIVKMP